jgi:hypothetical protein
MGPWMDSSEREATDRVRNVDLALVHEHLSVLGH